MGKELTASTLKKLYDGHFADVLGVIIKASSSGGKSKRFKVVKPLPSPDAYCDLRERHFTETIAEFVVDLRVPIEEGAEITNERLDNMSDSARVGERGQDAEEALNYLEGVLETVEEDSIPLVIRTLPILWIPEPVKGRSSRETESALKRIEFLKDYILNRFLHSLQDMAAMLPAMANARTASSLTAQLEDAEPDISGFGESLGGAADGLESALDLCPRSFPWLNRNRMNSAEPQVDQKPDATRSRKLMANTMATTGVIFVLLGLVHIFGGLPIILEATESGGINLPSIEDEDAGLQLLREPVVYGLLSLGVDRIILGVILLLCFPELKKGSRLAWRVCMAIGFLLLVGNVPLIWVSFERIHVLPLIMPAFGLIILVAILVGRRSFRLSRERVRRQ